MIMLNHKENILDDNFYNRGVELSYAIHIACMEDIFRDIIDIDNDSFSIEYDKDHNSYCLLHKSIKYSKIIPICYIGKDYSGMKKLTAGIYHSLKLAYAEELI